MSNLRSNSYRRAAPTGTGWSRRFSRVLPWIFVLCIVLGSVVPVRRWLHWPSRNDGALQEFETVWRQAGNLGQPRAVDVIRTIDGDTFEARVQLAPGREVTTRVRLRGIDAPELKGACSDEMRMAAAAASALRDLLSQGEVAIYNIGPDKYQGRVVADVATRLSGNVSAALIGAGHVRSYNGGHRSGWCANAAR
jgi:endonuclease YncB( thermonuclease family)